MRPLIVDRIIDRCADPADDQASPKALLHDRRRAAAGHRAGHCRAGGYDDLPATDVDAGKLLSARRRLERYLEPFSHTVAVMRTPRPCIPEVAFKYAQNLAADSRWSASAVRARGAHQLPSCRSTRRRHRSDELRRRRKACAPMVNLRRRDAARRNVPREDHWELAIRISETKRSCRISTSRRRPPWRGCIQYMRDHSSASRFMPVRRSGCRPSTRRSPSWCRPAGSRGCGSSTASAWTTAVSSWVGWQLSCGTSEFRWSWLYPNGEPAVASIAEHPFDLARARVPEVTVNTDNRLMSDTSMSLRNLVW